MWRLKTYNVMKKLFTLMVIVAAMAMVSCGGNKAKKAAEAEAAAVECCGECCEGEGECCKGEGECCKGEGDCCKGEGESCCQNAENAAE